MPRAHLLPLASNRPEQLAQPRTVAFAAGGRCSEDSASGDERPPHNVSPMLTGSVTVCFSLRSTVTQFAWARLYIEPRTWRTRPRGTQSVAVPVLCPQRSAGGVSISCRLELPPGGHVLQLHTHSPGRAAVSGSSQGHGPLSKRASRCLPPRRGAECGPAKPGFPTVLSAPACNRWANIDRFLPTWLLLRQSCAHDEEGVGSAQRTTHHNAPLGSVMRRLDGDTATCSQVSLPGAQFMSDDR